MNSQAIKVNSSLAIDRNSFSNALYNNFIKYADVTPKTLATYQRNLKQFFVWVKENNIVEPTREDVLSYRKALEDAGKKPATIQGYITTLRIFFSWTAEQGLYPNIADRVKGAKISREFKKDYLTANQIQIVLDSIDRTTVKGLRDYALIRLMTTCALRDIEISRARLEDIRTAGTETVLYIQGKGKTEKADFVIINKAEETAIREYLKTRPNAEPTEPLFVSTSRSNNGSSLSTRSVSEIVKDRLINAGFNSSKLTAHSLRHTGITLALKQGATVQEAQQYARHSNINTTMIYAHNLEKLNNTCASKVSCLIG